MFQPMRNKREEGEICFLFLSW